MDAAIGVGKCIVQQTCLVLVFIILASLPALKFGLIFKFLRPILGFFIGLTVGAYLVSLVSYDAVRLGSLFFGILGAVAAVILGGSQDT